MSNRLQNPRAFPAKSGAVKQDFKNQGDELVTVDITNLVHSEENVYYDISYINQTDEIQKGKNAD